MINLNSISTGLLKKAGVITCVVLVSGIMIHSVADTAITNRATTEQSTYLPGDIDFAGEKAPLNIADVRERFDRELLVNANLDATTLIIIKRANRVFPIMEPILKKYGIPDDFKYLAVIESGLVNAVSPAGARGIWQFMPETGKERGLEVNEIVDERYHLAKSTEAACKYLQAAYAKFGSWTLAAASYNGGFGGVNKQITFQGETNYYDLLLTEETSRYVFRILALKEIMKNPAKYNFAVAPAELYPLLPVKTVDVTTSIDDLAVFAKSQGINYKVLKIHNPWLRDRKLSNPGGKTYTLEIPTSGY